MTRGIPRPIAERVRSRQLGDIRVFLRSATPEQIQSLCFCAKEIELESKIPGLTPEQKKP